MFEPMYNETKAVCCGQISRMNLIILTVLVKYKQFFYGQMLKLKNT